MEVADAVSDDSFDSEGEILRLLAHYLLEITSYLSLGAEWWGQGHG
jgi:hypothetical protein